MIERILGLDPSLRGCGYVVLDKGKVVEQGTIRTTPEDGVPVVRYLIIKEAIDKIVKKYDIQYCSSEGVIFSDYTSEALYALYIILQIILCKHRIKVVYFQPSQWYAILYDSKKKRTREEKEILSIKKGKVYTMNRFKEDTGIKKVTSDEADAYYIGMYGIKFWNLLEDPKFEETLNKSEKFILTRTRIEKKGILKGEIIKEGMIYHKNTRWFDFSEGKYSHVD